MEINLRWYTRRNGQKEGSFSDRELAALIRQEILCEDDEIWTMQMQNWMKIKESVYRFYLPKEDHSISPSEEFTNTEDGALQVKMIRSNENDKEA